MKNNYNFFTIKNFNIVNLSKNSTLFLDLLALILITLPLKTIFISIATILFITVSIAINYGNRFKYSFKYFLPIALYFLMCISFFWTENQKLTLFGIQKELPILFIPIIFSFSGNFSKNQVLSIIRIFSFSMVIYDFYFFIVAFFNFQKTNNTDFFFYNNLVTHDPGAIYVSVFTSLSVFYFVQIERKIWIEKLSLLLLVIFIFLLSSKSIITIDFLVIIFYYAFFADIKFTTKATTIFSVSLFVFCSIFFVKEVREKFLLEYETAFVDNTLNNNFLLERGKTYNVSIKEAFNKKDFQPNNYFAGTALRVYQTRIFIEMLQEQNIFFQGFGLEASQYQISKKAKQHNLYFDYGNFNFHNQYIQTFAELGIFGFLFLLAMLYYNLRNGWRRKDFLHISFAITMIVLFLSESFFCRQRGVIFFITLYCLFNSISLIENKKEQPTL